MYFVKKKDESGWHVCSTGYPDDFITIIRNREELSLIIDRFEREEAFATKLNDIANKIPIFENTVEKNLTIMNSKLCGIDKRVADKIAEEMQSVEKNLSGIDKRVADKIAEEMIKLQSTLDKKIEDEMKRLGPMQQQQQQSPTQQLWHTLVEGAKASLIFSINKIMEEISGAWSVDYLRFLSRGQIQIFVATCPDTIGMANIDEVDEKIHFIEENDYRYWGNIIPEFYHSKLQNLFVDVSKCHEKFRKSAVEYLKNDKLFASDLLDEILDVEKTPLHTVEKNKTLTLKFKIKEGPKPFRFSSQKHAEIDREMDQMVESEREKTYLNAAKKMKI